MGRMTNRQTLFHVAALHRRLCSSGKTLQHAVGIAIFEFGKLFASLGEDLLDLAFFHRNAVDAVYTENSTLDIDLNEVALFDQRDRAAFGSFRRNMTFAGPRLAPEKRPSVSKAMLAESSGSLEMASVV